MTDTTINFQTNWNSKVDCKCFTTFRLAGSKYRIGGTYKILIKGQFVKVARCIDIKPLRLYQVNEWIARLDTGYSLEEFSHIVTTMYKNMVKDVQTQEFILVLLETID